MNHCAVAIEHDGNPSWTREHALMCEARMLARMSLAARREYLAAPLVNGRKDALLGCLEGIWRERGK